MPVRLVVCKGRRAGLSTGAVSLIYDDTTTNPNTKSLILANEKNPSENVLSMARDFWRYTPETMTVEGYTLKLRPDLPPEFRNNPPKDRLFFDLPLDSKIYLASAKSVDAYLSFGFQNLLATEAGYYTNGDSLFRALDSTVIKEAHSAIYIESTPNGQDGDGAWFYDQVMTAHGNKNSEFGETELVFIPWHLMTHSFSIPFEDPLKRDAFKRSLSKDEIGIMKRFSYVSLEQLLWRRTVLAGPGFVNAPDLFDQEFPSDLATAFLTSGSSVYARRSIKRMMEEHKREPIWEGDIYWGESDESNKHRPEYETVREPVFLEKWQAKDTYRVPHTNEKLYDNLKVYRWPKRGDRILICADVAGGREDTRGGDYSTICVGVMNALVRDELIMTWRGHLNELIFADVLCALAHAIRRMVGSDVPAPLLIPEWTGPGKATCTYIDKHSLYSPVYLYQAPGVKGFPVSRHLGHESNDKTKPLMVGTSVRMVDGDLMDVPDERLIMEMASYRQKDAYGGAGSYGSVGGKHNDMVSAFQILCMHMRFQAASIPMDGEMIDMNDAGFGFADDGEEEWSPFVGDRVLHTGISRRDVDEENAGEVLWWSG